MDITTKITLYTILAIVASVSTLVYIDYAYAEKLSLKQQIDNDLSINEIWCPNNNHVLVERTNGKLACVYNDTAEKFNWIIQDNEGKRIPLALQRVLDSCNSTGIQPSIGYRYSNDTHTIANNSCEWNLKTHDYEIEYDGGTYGNQYEIVGATVSEIKYDPESNSLSISLNESNDGYIHIVIPLELFQARHVDLEPSDPFTLIDGEEVAYEQLSPNQLKISFEKGDKLIEIIGTYQI